MKSKKKETLFEHEVFSDTDTARKERSHAELWFKIDLVMLIISLVAMLLFWIGSKLPNGNWFEGIALIIGTVSALVSGKIIYTLKYILKVAKFCWYIMPLFPLDLLMAAAGLILSFMTIPAAPILPCAYNLYQSYTKKKDADLYLA